MVDIGLEMVRIGEFAWSTYQSEPDRFQWGWLDQVVETLASAGLKVVLGTPTAAPPVWLSRKQPSVLSVAPDGSRRAYGSRRHTCPTSSVFREASQQVVTALVERYGRHSGVVAWQVDNEPGNHDSARCWCDECQIEFTRWLESRYETVETLNAVWGTAFWSQTYPDFEAVKLPVPTMTSHHPSLLLAHRRFANQQVLAGLTAQYEIIRGGSPGRDIATNVYSGDIELDPGALARLGGIYAIDSYPHGTEHPRETAFYLDRRPAGPDTRLWVMEQQIGRINWSPTNPPVPPGLVRSWIIDAARAGVEAMFFFRWRAARHGQEQYHSGLLDHDASPTVALAEVGAAIKEVVSFHAAARPEVALLSGIDDGWMIDIQPHRLGLTHRQLLLEAYSACRRLGVGVRVVSPGDDLTNYRLVLAPGLLMVTAERESALRAALAAGVTVVLGPRSFVMDAEGVFVDTPRPARFSEDLGARVIEADSQTYKIRVSLGHAPAGSWTEVLEPLRKDDPPRILATYEGEYLEGQPAAVNRGYLVYVGFSHEEAWMGLLAGILGSTYDVATN